ncbi:MAG: M48 family metallopeptidase, partial [Duncaniella sp.]|nr:M48 family metallopeptidase [Duncaniella sp.]
LGTCYPRLRRIRLSYLNVFLTPELRDYIICHELAHLTEPGHTPAFHALCDRYCLGRERELIRRLHTYPWPIER